MRDWLLSIDTHKKKRQLNDTDDEDQQNFAETTNLTQKKLLETLN